MSHRTTAAVEMQRTGRSRRSLFEAGLFATAGLLAAISQKAYAMTETSKEDRFSRGIGILRRIGGENFDGPINSLAEISADLSRFTVEYPYGDVLSRPGLELPLRQLCTISMLLADGSAQPQLKFHVAGFLNAGGEPRALVELMFVSVALLGFPPTINAIGIVRAVFAERKITFEPIEPAADDGRTRGQAGLAAIQRLCGGDVQAYFDGIAAGSPDLARLSIEFAFGEMLARDGLDQKAKLLAIIAILAASGNRAATLRLHIAGALAHGVTREEIIEVLIQLSVYRGFPSALNAFSVAKTVFAAGSQGMGADIALPIETQSRTDRLQRGRATLAKTSGSSADAVVRSFDDVAPDLGRMIVEHSYGEIFSRSGIDMKSRELSACAALAAIGSATTEIPLRVHINAALNVGATREEVLETLINLTAYCGYPTTQQAVRIATEEFAKRG
ncbi:carboxymuconolactone decarboxylase family protein [Bradyrhizobium sp. AUGA SZCCT0222]|uniref:carboxymuconolactone decarboxylase family protein n=1 Tax=Bradyrhizobium sp. AUGA SZCCT0222 TaxID=2807668 RepID=UPI001BA54C26|nr:carboxymuconolactone decarboxylase family protein [Bradyrhizobium sp. AUGA SZCCT0222]MBR1271242.1 carboxymuconolactone decarboxylase family protein [Bradyrhizobium sp. AUGA SZCCT0222]